MSKRFSAHAAYDALASDFRQVAEHTGMRIEPSRVAAIWEQGLLVAGTGAYAKSTHDGGRDVGLLHIATPHNLPLSTQDGAQVPPGDYVVHLTAAGAVALKAAAGGEPIPVAPPHTARMGTGGIFECSSGTHLEISYSNCRIAISLVCPGQWVYLIIVLEIPFCRFLTGLFDSQVNS